MLVGLVGLNVLSTQFVIRSENFFNVVKLLLLAGFVEVARVSDHALTVAAQDFMGRPGAIVIAIAVLLATSSAINATFYGTGRLTYMIAMSDELPRELERSIRGQRLEGTFITAALALRVANFVPLEAIATMGSAGFLLVFMAVNIAAVLLAAETGG